MATHGGKRKGTGGGKPRQSKSGALMVIGSVRMTPEQWKLFDKWGGAARLRQHMDKVKGGISKNAS